MLRLSNCPDSDRSPCLAPVTTSQKLNSVTVQGSCQSKTFHSPRHRGGGRRERERERTNQGVAGPRSRRTNPPRVVKSPTQLTNISMGITQALQYSHFVFGECDHIKYTYWICFPNYTLTAAGFFYYYLLSVHQIHTRLTPIGYWACHIQR